MTAATFNKVGVTPVPVRADRSVFYGASYERSDGALIVFLGMSTSHQADGQGFSDGVIRGTLARGDTFSAGVTDVVGVEGESNGIRTVAIGFARNGRGYTVLSFGENTRDDASKFAKFIVGLAESTPTRPDAKPVHKLRPAAVGLAACIALAVIGIAASWQLVRKRRTESHGGAPTTRSGRQSDEPANPWKRTTDTADTLEHPIPADSSPRPSPRPNPR